LARRPWSRTGWVAARIVGTTEGITEKTAGTTEGTAEMTDEIVGDGSSRAQNQRGKRSLGWASPSF
jgi:hypothetical protein